MGVNLKDITQELKQEHIKLRQFQKGLAKAEGIFEVDPTPKHRDKIVFIQKMMNQHRLDIIKLKAKFKHVKRMIRKDQRERDQIKRNKTRKTNQHRPQRRRSKDVKTQRNKNILAHDSSKKGEGVSTKSKHYSKNPRAKHTNTNSRVNSSTVYTTPPHHGHNTVLTVDMDMNPIHPPSRRNLFQSPTSIPYAGYATSVPETGYSEHDPQDIPDAGFSTPIPEAILVSDEKETLPATQRPNRQKSSSKKKPKSKTKSENNKKISTK